LGNQTFPRGGAPRESLISLGTSLGQIFSDKSCGFSTVCPRCRLLSRREDLQGGQLKIVALIMRTVSQGTFLPPYTLLIHNIWVHMDLNHKKIVLLSLTFPQELLLAAFGSIDLMIIVCHNIKCV